VLALAHRPAPRQEDEVMADWNAEKSAHLYGLDSWGAGYFAIADSG